MFVPSSSLTEMMGELFLALDMPEPPKKSFFEGLFGGGARILDREELFGEATSGKASKGVAKHMPGQAMQERVNSATSEVSRAHQLMLERGDKLNRLEERTERMMNQAENFADNAHQLAAKYKDKKWYQL